MLTFLMILLFIGVAVFLFAFIKWLIMCVKNRNNNSFEAVEKILYWNIWIAGSALWVNLINIFIKLVRAG